MARSHEEILDEWLVLRAQQGEIEALRELVTQWQPRLWRHASYLTGQSDAAGDALQDAWVAIVRGLPKLKDPAAFRSWAYRIVSRRCTDWIRRQQHDRELQRQAMNRSDAIESRSSSMEQGEDDIGRVRQALRGLPAHHRSVLSLCYLDGLSIREIAQALEIPAGTVKSRLHNARNILRETLERVSK